MGTKTNPGEFDCYHKAEPDEPIFVLLGRDPLAPALVSAWAMNRERMGRDGNGPTERDLQKAAEARHCALAMMEYLTVKLGRKFVIPTFIPIEKLQTDVSAWATATFPTENLDMRLRHLREEIDEIAALPSDIEEWADALMLLLNSAKMAGHSIRDIVAEGFRKLEKNKRRKWLPPDENGVIRHAPEDAA